jgi:hypothetical protein
LTQFESTAEGRVYDALDATLAHDSAALRKRTLAKLKIVKQRGFRERRGARVVARLCDGYTEVALLEIRDEPELAALPMDETHFWWKDMGGLIRVLTDTEGRAETLLRRFEARVRRLRLAFRA